MQLVLSLLAACAAPKTTLTYFPIAARGELARLYGYAGGVSFIDSTNATGYKQTPLHFLPVLDSDRLSFRLQESLAVERYMRSIGPLYANLTAEQEALDDEFAEVKEDLIGGKYSTTSCYTNRTYAKVCVAKLFDRYLAGLETLIPTDAGFANGLGFPTGADLVCLLIAKAGTPWGYAMKFGQYTGWEAKFPKVARVAELAAKFRPVAAYLASSKTFYVETPDSRLDD